ncbi:hypothetical protein [Natronorubrum halophilum]|uniref:hypothetical protein n=1 Tax=Natronorubrum halophilum TaxID=1702106 RepID=UPI0010C1A748|nr:hypothetical protein [Natronorubrum halophilum]
MPALWTYPWTLDHEGIDDACERLSTCGIDAVNVASHYHSVQSMQARFPDDLFRAYAGGCYFEPDERFDDVPIEPSTNRVGSWDDPLAEITDGVHDHGMAVNAWTVCLHNTRLGSMNPAYRIESAFGDAHDHSLCPSHPEVRAYFAAVVASIRERDVDEIQLESIGFPSAFHDHGSQYGHDKRQTVTTDTETVLLSQCFCEGCHTAAASHPIEFERAHNRVRELVRPSLVDPTVSLPPIDELVECEPLVGDLLDFRATVIEALLERLANAAGSTPLNYYVMEAYGQDPSTLPFAGVDLERLEPHLDRVTALCYVSDAERARDRILTLERVVDLPIDSGITLDPAVIERSAQVGDLVDGIRLTTDGTISIYHHSLATETHLEWIADAVV